MAGGCGKDEAAMPDDSGRRDDYYENTGGNQDPDNSQNQNPDNSQNQDPNNSQNQDPENSQNQENGNPGQENDRADAESQIVGDWVAADGQESFTFTPDGSFFGVAGNELGFHTEGLQEVTGTYIYNEPAHWLFITERSGKSVYQIGLSCRIEGDRMTLTAESGRTLLLTKLK